MVLYQKFKSCACESVESEISQQFLSNMISSARILLTFFDLSMHVVVIVWHVCTV